VTGSGDTVRAVTTARRGRLHSAALIASALAVVVVAAGFDVLAGERPDHTLSLVLVAIAVGGLRWALRGRLRGLFTLINLAVVTQPVAHGVSEWAGGTASLLPHSHVVPEELSGLTVQVAVALLVAVVAGSEPIAVFVASTVLTVAAAVARARVPDAAAPVVLPARRERETAPDEVDAVRCRPHRGPPALVGLAV